jgi:DNA-binding transcriptional LysR family regulator
MESRLLRYFLAVAKAGNISRAADFLHVTQPTLSRQMKELEGKLGEKLFFRSNRGMTLTEKGLRFRKRAEEITDLAEKILADFRSSSQPLKGEIFIGGGESAAIRLIAKTAVAFSGRHPNVRYRLFSGNSGEVLERLERGLLDFGLLIGHETHSKYEYIKLPDSDIWGLLTRSDSPLATLDVVRSSDLRDIPLIVSKQALERNELREWFGPEAQNLNIVATYNLIFNASIMAREGLGHALCLDGLVNTSKNTGLSFKPFFPRVESSVTVVWKKYQRFSDAAELFLTYLQSECGLSDNK